MVTVIGIILAFIAGYIWGLEANSKNKSIEE